MYKYLLLPAAILAIVVAGAATSDRAAGVPSGADRVQRGRYLVAIGGCNDCHTAGYAPSGGKVAESQWLLGDTVGWNGPWGTTYAPNLRLQLTAMDAASFRTYARALKARPPMPYWALNAMSDDDLDALLAYVKSLGPAGAPAPAALAPGVAPQGPVVRFPAPLPEGAMR
jgi:mono/diheme cytochrome c family protein